MSNDSFVVSEKEVLLESNIDNKFIPIEISNPIEIEPELQDINVETESKLKEIFSCDSINLLPLDDSINELNIIEHPSPFNMDNDFPSLTPIKSIGQNSSPINFIKIKEQTSSPINFIKIKEQTEERMRLKEKQDEEKIEMKEKDYQKKFSTEITNTLLDDENRKLKRENNMLSSQLKECEEKLRTFNFKMETLKEFHKDTNTREYLTKWINNMHLVDNSAIYALNNTNYKDVKFVKKIYNNDLEFERNIN